MKKKNLTYLLLILVAGIWGYLFYKFFSDINPENQTIIESKPISMALVQETKDSVYALIANYRDPFLGTAANINSNAEKRIVTKKPKPKPILPVITVPNIVWQNIKYLGLISHKANAKHMGIITINNIEHTVTEGITKDEFTILKLSKTEATLLYKGEQKVIKRE